MSKKDIFLLIFLILALPERSLAQLSILFPQLASLQEESGGILGVSILNIETGDSISLNGRQPFVMQSSFKYPIALTVLSLVDKKRLFLHQKVKVNKVKMDKETWSPMREELPEGEAEIKLSDLMVYMVSHSDNIACDILLEMIGGPLVVERFIRGVGIKQISIKYNEEEMSKSWKAQYKNWVHPNAMVELMSLFQKEKVVSRASSQYLMKLMEETSTGKDRLKGLLPEGTVIAHRTGTSGRNKEGNIAAVVDSGIINLPNKQHIAIAVFVADSKKDTPVIELVIAKIGKVVWESEVKN